MVRQYHGLQTGVGSPPRAPAKNMTKPTVLISTKVPLPSWLLCSITAVIATTNKVLTIRQAGYTRRHTCWCRGGRRALGEDSVTHPRSFSHPVTIWVPTVCYALGQALKMQRRVRHSTCPQGAHSLWKKTQKNRPMTPSERCHNEGINLGLASWRLGDPEQSQSCSFV